ncbi:MAG: hypothetical protein KatS3mg089_0102 [Patescibacteria group bacterium]|nr:MAG: hypothetical protein KatS3mg089_0102 [Patescibacteria group bacterium]
MNKKQYQNLIYLIIPSFVVILAWIGFTIYNKRVATTITESQSLTILPINSSFNKEVLNRLKKRKVITPNLNYLQTDNQISSQEASLTITPIPPAEPIATVEAETQGETTQ